MTERRISSNNTAIIELIKNSRDANATEVDINGWNALHHACDSSIWCERGSRSAIDLLKNHDCDVHAVTTGPRPPEYTALHFACDGSDKTFSRGDIVELLLKKDADIEAKDTHGNTPLLLAAACGWLACWSWLARWLAVVVGCRQ